MKPSDEIQKINDAMEYDWREPCGANHCECYDNSKMIEAILKYLDKKTASSVEFISNDINPEDVAL